MMSTLFHNNQIFKTTWLPALLCQKPRITRAGKSRLAKELFQSGAKVSNIVLRRPAKFYSSGNLENLRKRDDHKTQLANKGRDYFAFLSHFSYLASADVRYQSVSEWQCLLICSSGWSYFPSAFIQLVLLRWMRQARSVMTSKSVWGCAVSGTSRMVPAKTSQLRGKSKLSRVRSFSMWTFSWCGHARCSF